MFKFCLLIVATLALGLQAVKGQIVGGDDAEENEFPYYVFLKDGGIYFCSGALVSLKHVLTAAHCVTSKNRLSRLAAIVGTNNIKRGGLSYCIVKKSINPDYCDKPPDKNSWLNDISIYTLGSDITPSTSVKVGSLPTRHIVQIDRAATVVGSGRKTIDGPDSEILQKMSVTIIDLNLCRYMLRYHIITIDVSHICTLVPEGTGISYGDSGGPLIQTGFIIGIAVGVIGGPGTLGYPDVYTNIFLHLPYITRVLEE